jgi:hypothetical protein
MNDDIVERLQDSLDYEFQLSFSERKILLDCITNLQEENEGLNNIINELEKDIIEKINDIKNNYSQVNGNYFNMNYVLDTYEDVLNKLQELKGSESNE